MAQKHVRGQTLKQQTEKEATAFNDGAASKKGKKAGMLRYTVNFQEPLGPCGCGNDIGTIGYRLGEALLCHSCALPYRIEDKK